MIASISLDLDNQWSYMKTHGDPGWESYPTYLPTLVPRILRLLDQRNLKITFFIVGADADQDENTAALRSIPQAGHEVGNHSYHHEPWLHLYSDPQLSEEFDRSEQAIGRCTGERTVGFRGPGFSYSRKVLELLAQRGYHYDASTFPTFLGPVARAYYFLHSRLDRQDRDQRKQLFGSFRNGFQPLRPYRWSQLEKPLIEIPVTTMPWFKIPMHLSYIMYLAGFSPWLARTYFQVAMRFCKWNGIEPSLLLHPLDFMGQDDGTDLDFFPGMSLPFQKKVDLADKLLGWMSRQFQCCTLQQHAHAFRSR